jgi:pimeloyl-ACP methyl ester carboxylesterase
VRSLVVALLAVALVAPAAIAAPQRSIADVPIRAVKAGQGTIGYRSVGNGGRPLVLVMGLSGTMDAWPPSFVDALAARRRVITLDNEGIRRTTLGPGALTIRRMADDVASLIRALHLREADVLGWSMGGMIAQSLARRHPNRVRRLVLCATAPGNGRATLPAPDALSANTYQLLFPPGQEAASARFLREITSYRNASPAAPPEITRAQMTASAASLAGRDPSGRPLRRLRMPVLVGGGALDRLLPVANQRYLARVLPNARLRVYRDAAHGFLFQHQREFLRQIERFLGGEGPAARPSLSGPSGDTASIAAGGNP